MSTPGLDWRRAARGVFWIGIGAFLLMNTQGWLPWSFWLDALAYWPMLLVAAGLGLMFDRTRHPWAAFLSPLLLLGTLAFVAFGTPRVPSGDRFPVQADRPQGTQRWWLGGTVVFSTLEVDAGDLPAERLVDGTVISRRDPSVRVSHSAEEARVRLAGARRGPVILLPARDERWDLTVSDDLPVELDLELAFDLGELDLSAVEVTQVDLHGAFNDLQLRLGTPARDVRVNIEGAFNELTLVVPADVPVRTNTDGLLNLIDRRRETPSTGGPSYRLRVEGAFSRTIVRSE